MYKNELTFMQRAAIEGEIAYLIATANHDSEILFRLYCVLSEAPEDIKELVLDCFKPLICFPEEIYAKILGDINMNKIPMWLWEEQVIADIKQVIKFGEAPDTENLRISNKELRKLVAKSAFILFCKKLCEHSVRVPVSLCRKIINDNKLDFLHNACFALINDLTEALNMGIAVSDDSDESLQKILEISFRILIGPFPKNGSRFIISRS